MRVQIGGVEIDGIERACILDGLVRRVSWARAKVATVQVSSRFSILSRSLEEEQARPRTVVGGQTSDMYVSDFWDLGACVEVQHPKPCGIYAQYIMHEFCCFTRAVYRPMRPALREACVMIRVKVRQEVGRASFDGTVPESIDSDRHAIEHFVRGYALRPFRGRKDGCPLLDGRVFVRGHTASAGMPRNITFRPCFATHRACNVLHTCFERIFELLLSFLRRTWHVWMPCQSRSFGRWRHAPSDARRFSTPIRCRGPWRPIFGGRRNVTGGRWILRRSRVHAKKICSM